MGHRQVPRLAIAPRQRVVGDGAHAVAAGQKRQVLELYFAAIFVRPDALRRFSIHFGAEPIHGRAVRAHNTDRDARRTPLARANPHADTQVVALVEHALARIDERTVTGKVVLETS